MGSFFPDEITTKGMDVRQMELKDMISCLRIEGKGMRQICRVAAYLNKSFQPTAKFAAAELYRWTKRERKRTSIQHIRHSIG
jgi:hypothetical protein